MTKTVVCLFVLLTLSSCASTNNIVASQPSLVYDIIEESPPVKMQKSTWVKDTKALKSYLLNLDQSNNAKIPAKWHILYDVIETEINGRPFAILSPKNTKTKPNQWKKIVFFMNGGGFVYEMMMIHRYVIEEILNKLKIPVAVALYPIYPVTDPNVILGYAQEAYRQTLVAAPNAKIVMMGDSAGAILALALCHSISDGDSGLAKSLSFPEKLILVSPGQIMERDELVLAQMRALDSKDVVLSVKMLETLPELFGQVGKTNWLTAPFEGDFSKFPPTYIFSGTDEIFYPQMKPFVQRLKKQGVKTEFYSGNGMMHVWPYIPLAPESRAALKVIFGIIKGKN